MFVFYGQKRCYHTLSVIYLTVVRKSQSTNVKTFTPITKFTGNQHDSSLIVTEMISKIGLPSRHLKALSHKTNVTSLR